MPLTRSIEKYDRKLAGILSAAAEVFAGEGYDRASIRMVAERAGVSVPGLYYYVRSKEELLLHIQLHVFTTLVERHRAERTEGERPEERLRRLVRTHLAYFLEHMDELVVCAREIDRLEGELRARVEAKQREYFALAVKIFADLARGRDGACSARTAALALFGTINWIHTWYRPERGPGREKLVDEVVGLYLRGAPAGRDRRRLAGGGSRDAGKGRGSGASRRTPGG